jgi:hypothetical protein
MRRLLVGVALSAGMFLSGCASLQSSAAFGTTHGRLVPFDRRGVTNLVPATDGASTPIPTTVDVVVR